MIDKLMRVEKLGSGDPELTVVGSIHGDEPCGKKAIERFLNSKPDLKKPVKFIIANQKALEKEKRFLEGDLNRAFSGDTRSSKHEGRRYYSSSESKYFQKTEKVEGNWGFRAKNFEKVEEGEIYAEKNNGEDLKAEEEFYPVLMLNNGYEDILGFKAEKVSKDNLLKDLRL